MLTAVVYFDSSCAFWQQFYFDTVTIRVKLLRSWVTGSKCVIDIQSLYTVNKKPQGVCWRDAVGSSFDS